MVNNSNTINQMNNLKTYTPNVDKADYKYSNTSIPEIYKNVFRFLISCLNRMYLLLLLEEKRIFPFIDTNYKIKEQKYFLMNI
jgi:hypothetical protein